MGQHCASSPSEPFSANKRLDNLERMEQEPFDLLIIGGGLTGAGIASEAARWGYKVALVEKGDFASGASGKTSKLVHGSLRYLSTLHFGLIFEACHQRHQLLRLAPHLVWPLPFIAPVYCDGPRPLWQIRMALRLYDTVVTFPTVLAPPMGWGQQRWSPHQIWSPSQALENEPLLNPQGLIGAAYYYDCGSDDVRLTLTTLLEAHRAGATLANYTEVVALLQGKNRIVGARLRDHQAGREISLRARVIISAAGAWTGRILQMAKSPAEGWRQVTKTVHLVIRRDRLPNRTAITFNSPRDGRFLSLTPWGSHSLIGAAETQGEGDPEAVFATPAEVTYLLEATQHTFPSAALSEEDVITTCAGLRPQLCQQRDTRPQRRSRPYLTEEIKPGLIAVAGGKLALYRPLAWEVVNQVARILAQDHARYPIRPPGAAQPPLSGRIFEDWDNYRSHWQAALAVGSPLADDIARHLVATYGSELPVVLKLLAEAPVLAQRLTPDLPLVKAQVIHAIRHEMALTLGDVLDRRTHLLTQAADQGLGAVESVAGLMAAELGWTPEKRARQIASYRQQLTATSLRRERIAA